MEVAGAGGTSCTEKAVGAIQTRSGADISQPANFSQFCFLASETSWFLPVHPFSSLHCAASEQGGRCIIRVVRSPNHKLIRQICNWLSPSLHTCVGHAGRVPKGPEGRTGTQKRGCRASLIDLHKQGEMDYRRGRAIVALRLVGGHL